MLGAGSSWRLAFVLIAGLSAAAWCARHGRAELGQDKSHSMGTGPTPDSADADHAVNDDSAWPGWRAAGSIVRQFGALRWLMLLEVANLLLDVLTPFLALYLVAVGHVVAVGGGARRRRAPGAGLAGDVIVIRVLDRSDGRRRAAGQHLGGLALFPAFLLVPGLGQQAGAAGGADDRDRALVSRAPG